ncbi:MAG TPA: ATP-binding protein [Holophagaceae bacterium]|jgi:PAS domain S-box-containing protein|nr:ATP-binding protein [Holophagaceae bacterium]
MTPSRSLALKALAVAVIYAVLGQLSVYPAILGSINMEAIWLPSGFLFAVLMRSPRRQWALLLGPAVLAGLAVNWYQMRVFVPSFAFALTDPLEVLGGAWAATALLKGRAMDLSRTSDALILGLAGILNGLVAGPIGLLAARAGGLTIPGEFMGLVWGNSVLLSHLFIAPLILAWPTMGANRSRVLGESILWMALSAGVTRWGLHHGAPDGVQGLLMFLPFPLLAAAAVRTGPWGASLALAGVSFTALLESSHGHGPLPTQSLTPDLVMVWMQMFLGTETASIMILACASEAQKRAEGSLLESESRYRTLVEQFPDAIILRDGSRIRYANPAAVKLFAAPDAAGLEGRSIREFLERQEASSGELTRSGVHRYTAALRERMLKTLDGREVPVEVTDISIALTQGRPLILDVFRDLTKRRAMEDALRRSEQDFQRFFDMAPMPLVLAERPDGRVLRANALAVELFEAEGADLESLRTGDFYVRAEDRTRLREAVAARGRLDSMEVDVLTHKGRLRRVLASAALVSYSGRDALLAGFMDVTLRMKTEEALRQAQKLESLGLMAGGVAHDFNNLLTALIGNLELARLAQQEEMPAELFFDAMAATLRRAGDLSRQMLAYAGQAQVEILPVDINASARELAALMAASMSKKIELRFDLAEDLPLVEGDPVQLQQVLLNLVTNAADAIGGNEGAITLSSRVEDAAPDTEPGSHPGRSVVLEVRDTGVGMSEKVRARIFDPFFTTKAAGRGLGLSTLLGILKAHHASVRVDSEPGSGSRFILRFPLPEKLSIPRPGATTGPFSIEGLEGLVLLVDDETDIRMTAGSQLQRMGLHVVEAADGREALREVERHSAALKLVILDLSMPRMDGAEALARIRETHPALPVILSSGFDPNQRTPELLKQPKTWFLPKPYRLSELRRLVGEVLATG